MIPNTSHSDFLKLGVCARRKRGLAENEVGKNLNIRGNVEDPGFP